MRDGKEVEGRVGREEGEREGKGRRGRVRGSGAIQFASRRHRHSYATGS